MVRRRPGEKPKLVNQSFEKITAEFDHHYATSWRSAAFSADEAARLAAKG
jgi:hypothetical protein